MGSIVEQGTLEHEIQQQEIVSMIFFVEKHVRLEMTLEIFGLCVTAPETTRK